MRIKDGLKRSGIFWLPSSKETQASGVLTIDNGGKIRIEITGMLGSEAEIDAFNSDDYHIGRIVGQLDVGGWITLDNCIYADRNFSFGNGISTSTIYSSMAIIGAGYELDEEIFLTSFSFCVDGLDVWLQKGGIKRTFDNDTNSLTISYTRPNSIVINLDSGLQLSVDFGYSIPGTNGISEFHLKQLTFIKLTSPTPRRLVDFMGACHKINNFVSFAVDTTTGLYNVVGRSEEVFTEVNGEKQLLPIEFYYQSVPFVPSPPTINHHDALFHLRDIEDRFEQTMNAWFSSYEKIKPSLDLYFAVSTGVYKYLDGRFLALAQSIETYHRRTSTETMMDTQAFRSLVAAVVWSTPKKNRRWALGRLKFGNEITLAQRITKTLLPFTEHFGNKRTRTKFVRNVVDTRNYMTHYNHKLQSKVMDKSKLFKLTSKLEALFQLTLLLEIGFSTEQINKILKHNQRLGQKII